MSWGVALVWLSWICMAHGAWFVNAKHKCPPCPHETAMQPYTRPARDIDSLMARYDVYLDSVMTSQPESEQRRIYVITAEELEQLLQMIDDERR